MQSNDIVAIVAIIAVIGIPMLGLTARFALKPVVDSVIRLREAMDRDHQVVEDPRVPMIVEQLNELRETVERLEAAADFDSQLRGGAHPRQQLPGS